MPSCACQLRALFPCATPQAQRLAVLQYYLGQINAEVEAAAARGTPIWYPVGAERQRVLRLCTADAAILNSRDKVRLRGVGLE